MPKKILKLLSQFILVLLIFAVIGVSVLYLTLAPQLPSIEGLSDVRLQVPLRIYSSDGSLMGEFGEKRRTPKTLEEIPLLMRQAFLAAEDDRFFEHPGVDYQGIARAALHLIMTGERGQGGSTITMQLARNFYLSREKTYARKLSEILLALKIERELSKEKILELYLNKIYLGNRAYGVAAAAQAYYGRELEQLDLAQIAMIAGLPKAPSRYNPIVNPERAISRREYVLTRMLELGYISTELYDQAHVAPVTAERHSAQIQLEAPYVNEMVRLEIVSQFGDEAYTRGLKVYTTVQDKLQTAASSSLQQGLIDYDQRHGYRGAVRRVNLDDYLKETDLVDDQEQVDVARVLENDSEHGRFQPALVLKLQETGAAEDLDFVPHAVVALRDGTEIRLDLEAMLWARPFISLNRQGDEPKQISEVLKVGDVIWVLQNNDGKWMLGQVPEVQGALVALAPNDGAITALAGGFNYVKSNFNRAVQARRQAGSGFKPIIYSAALSHDHTPASIINDAPVVFEDAALEGAWRPENYSGKFYGPTRLREALVKSRNLVSIRLLNAIGVNRAVRFARRFGFDSEALPHDLSLALGSCEVSPLEMARAFAVFANGGYLTQPYFITRIEDADGRILFEADPSVACVACVLAKRRQPPPEPSAADNDDEPLIAANEEVIGQPLATGDAAAEAPKVETAGDDEEETLVRLPKQADQTLEPRLAYIMHSMLQDVVLRGTGRRAMQLGRRDLAGKTGTTNDQRDAWFNGYHPDLVAVTWVGYDHLKPLGNSETGSRAALPLWIEFMRAALAGKPEKQLPRPEGLATVKINADTGEAAADTDKNTVFELFRAENAPVPGKTVSNPVPVNGGDSQPIPEQLF